MTEEKRSSENMKEHKRGKSRSNHDSNVPSLSTGSHQLKDYYKSLIALLKCSNPRCRRFLSVPVCQCVEGHSICTRCVHKNCAICGQTVISTENIILNNIVKKLVFPCINKPKGCKENFPPRLLKNHERECHHGMVICKVRGCGHKCAHTVLWEHTVDNHPGVACSVATSKIIINMFQKETFYNFMLFGLYNCLFNGLLTYIENKKTISAAAQLVHSSQKHTKFMYEIYLVETGNMQHLLFSKEVLGENEDIEEAIRENNCFALQLKNTSKEAGQPGSIQIFHFKIIPTKLAKKNFR